MFSSVSLSPAAMLSSGCQALELRERVHGGARCWCVQLCQREGEDNLLILQKCKACKRGGSLKIFNGISVLLI